MTKKQIEKAFSEYYYKHGTGDWREDEIMKEAFARGAQWRIDSVWHYAEEEPKQNAWFIAQIGDDAFDTFIMQIESNRWDGWCNGLNIRYWAYIDDLLPERKEK